jgi:hypothetical protein
VLGSVLALHVGDRVLTNGRDISWSALNNLGRLGANLFCPIQSVIEMNAHRDP